jgi:ketosteroid isomerase-like protein
MASDTASFEARLQRLEDVEAIRRLLQDYRRFLDAKDFAAYADLFSRDGGEWHGGLGRAQGPDAIRALLEEKIGYAAPERPQNGHLVVNPVIEVNGDSATAESTWVFVGLGDDGRPTMLLVGHYSDELVRDGGTWKFQRRRAHTDLPFHELSN